MHNRLGWDELRLVLEIGRGGGLSGAARALGVNHATVFRKLNGIEGRLGVRLFERFHTGYAPTPAGEAAIALARQVDDEVRVLERRLAGQDVRPSGTVRITTTDTLLPLLGPCLAEIRRSHPEITLEILVSNAFLSLSRRDADVALRPTLQPPPELVGRRIANIAFAVYMARAHAPRRRSSSPVAMADLAWVAPDDSLAHLESAKWMRAHLPQAQVVGRSDTLVGLLEMARAGLGAAALPCYLGDADRGLRRLGAPEPAMQTQLWLLTHEDLRRVARVRAVLDGLSLALEQRRGQLEGAVARRAQDSHPDPRGDARLPAHWRSR